MVARVLVIGALLTLGVPVEVQARPCPQWTPYMWMVPALKRHDGQVLSTINAPPPFAMETWGWEDPERTWTLVLRNTHTEAACIWATGKGWTDHARPIGERS